MSLILALVQKLLNFFFRGGGGLKGSQGGIGMWNLQFAVTNKKQTIGMNFSNYCSRVIRYSLTWENLACLRSSCFLSITLTIFVFSLDLHPWKKSNGVERKQLLCFVLFLKQKIDTAWCSNKSQFHEEIFMWFIPHSHQTISCLNSSFTKGVGSSRPHQKFFFW